MRISAHTQVYVETPKGQNLVGAQNLTAQAKLKWLPVNNTKVQAISQISDPIKAHLPVSATIHAISQTSKPAALAIKKANAPEFFDVDY